MSPALKNQAVERGCKMTRKFYLVTLLLVPLLMISSVTRAQSNRVFVAAKTGNDSSSCNDVNTPCRTFAGAVTQVSAGGEAIALESGGYGPVTITKAVNVNAPAGIVAFIHPPSRDAITGYSNNGIQFTASGGTLFMRDDDVRMCYWGVIVTSSGSSARAVIRDSNFVNNLVSVYAAQASIVSVTNSVASGNGNRFEAQTPSVANADLTLERVQAVSNGYGVYAYGAGGGTATVRLANSVISRSMPSTMILK